MKTLALIVLAIVYLIPMGNCFEVFEREAGLRQ